MNAKEVYDAMLLEFDRCWICGRTADFSDKPAWWYAPWLIERHHVVRNPRVEDRRAVICLCSLCHRVQHGDRFVGSWLLPSKTVCHRATLSQLLWVKKKHDLAYWDRAWLAQHVVGKLPRAKELR